MGVGCAVALATLVGDGGAEVGAGGGVHVKVGVQTALTTRPGLGATVGVAVEPPVLTPQLKRYLSLMSDISKSDMVNF